MTAFSIVTSVVAAICATLSVIFAVLAFSRNRKNDQSAFLLDINTKLTRVEADIMYMRTSMDKNDDRFDKIDARFDRVEDRLITLERISHD